MILVEMQEMKSPLTISKPRFTPHMLVAMPYRSKCFFVITFQNPNSIDFSIRDYPEIVSEQINSLTNFFVTGFDHFLYLAGGTGYTNDGDAFQSQKGFIYNVLNKTWTIGPS